MKIEDFIDKCNCDFLFPISTKVAAKTIGFDLVSVIPMNVPIYQSYCVDYHYSFGIKKEIFLISTFNNEKLGLIKNKKYLVGITEDDQYNYKDMIVNKDFFIIIEESRKQKLKNIYTKKPEN
jgi:hypothetical protein